MMTSKRVLLGLPAFLLHLVFIFWSTALGGLCYKLRVLQFTGKRNDMHTWAQFLNWYFGVSFFKKGSQSLYKPADGRPCMFLANHRSWADFFTDVWLTEGNAAPLARLAVFFTMPALMSYCMLLKGIIFFKRQTIADKEGFNTWLDGCIRASPSNGLLVFPEGHRNFKSSAPLPLKRGMLNYAYSRKMPVQVVMSRGKELVINERDFESHRGTRIVTSFSEVLESSKFASFDDFMAGLQVVWDAMWQDVVRTPPKWEELQHLEQPDPVAHDYPLKMRLLLLLHVLANSVLMIGVMSALALAGRAVLLLLPAAARQVLALGLGVWMAASLLTWMTAAPEEHGPPPQGAQQQDGSKKGQ